SAQSTKVTVGYPAIAAGHLPAWLAKEAGGFAKNSLDVQMVYFRGGNPAVIGLLSRQNPISQVGGIILNGSLRGADAVIIAGGGVTVESLSVLTSVPSNCFMAATNMPSPRLKQNG